MRSDKGESVRAGKKHEAPLDLLNDWGFWALYLDRGGRFFEGLRPILVKALRGDPRPGGRKRSVTTSFLHARIAVFVGEREKECGRDQAVQQAADKFRMTSRKVYAEVAKYEPLLSVLRGDRRPEIHSWMKHVGPSEFFVAAMAIVTAMDAQGLTGATFLNALGEAFADGTLDEKK
jgi:hypothetical protein